MKYPPFFRATVVLLISTFLLGIIQPLSPAIASGPEYLSLSDSYLSLRVKLSNGRYLLDSVQGVPRRPADNNKTLLAESFTSFRIEGEDYIFGNSYGLFGSTASLVTAPKLVGREIHTVWQAKGVTITQVLRLIEDTQSPYLGNIHVSYEVTNNAAHAVEVGARMLLDTKLGANDGTPLTLPGSNNYVTNECELSPAPVYWRAVDSLLAPRIMTFGQLSVNGMEAPDRMVVAHWEAISCTKWDYQPDIFTNFTEKSNAYGSADSAVALYWDPASLQPSTTRTYETIYGLGDIVALAGELDYDLRVFAPNRLTLNESSTGYAESPFLISVEIDNTVIGQRYLPDVEITLDLSPARGVLKLAEGEKATKAIKPGVMPGTFKTLSWRVAANPMYAPRAARYRIQVSIDGVEEHVVTGMLLVPQVAGDPPPLQVVGATPNVIHTAEANRQVTLRGSGFDALLLPETNWSVRLIKNSDPDDIVVVPIDTNDTYIEVNPNSIAVKMPDELWGGTGPKLEGYTIELNAGQLGVFRESITFTRNDDYRTRSYGILVAFKQDGEYYGLSPVSDEAALNSLRTELGENLLLEVRGEILARQGALPGYSGTYYEILPNSVINSKVHFTEDAMLTAAYGEGYQRLTAYAKNSSVYIGGTGGLSLPGFPFYAGEFDIELLQGTRYSLEPRQNESPISITWVPTSEHYAQVSMISVFPVIVTKAQITTDKVNFSGKLLLLLDTVMRDRQRTGDETTMLNLINFGIDIKQAPYLVTGDKVELVGLQASGEVGLLNKLIPFNAMDFGAGAKVEIDTFSGTYAIAADINFYVIRFEGEIILKVVNDILLPDAIHFMVKGSPGIPIAPPYPVLFITQGGGGFEGVADTFAGRYNSVPPLKLHFIGGADVAKALKLKDVTLTVSLREVGLRSKVGFFMIPVLDNYYGYLRYDDSNGAFEMKGGATVNLLSRLIYGDAALTLRYHPGKDYGLFGPVYVGGWATTSITLPKMIPLVGGKRIAAMGMEISSTRFYGDTVIAGVPIWIEYRWGASSASINVDTPIWLGGSAPENYGPERTDIMFMGAVDTSQSENNEAQLVFGSNLKVLGVSENDSIPLGLDGITQVSISDDYELGVMGLRSMTLSEPVIISSPNYTEHELTLQGLDNGLIVLRFAGDVPGYEDVSIKDIVVLKPDGNVYPLLLDDPDDDTDDGDANCLMQVLEADESSSGLKERLFAIGLPSPDDGTWRILTRVSTTSVAILNAKGARRLSNVVVEAENPSGHHVRVTWQSSNLQGGEKVTLLLCSNEQDQSGSFTDAGSIIAEDLDAFSGSYSGIISDRFASGEYYMRAVVSGTDINDETTNYHSAYSTTAIRIVNPYQPDKPTGLNVASIGNGFLHANWAKQYSIDGFFVEIYGEDGNPLEHVGPVQTSWTDTEVILGGVFQAANIVSVGEEGENAELPVEPLGLIPGQSYQVALTAYREVNGVLHFSEPAMSPLVEIPAPNPARLSFDLYAGDKALNAQPDAHGVAFVSNCSQVRVVLETDQDLQDISVEILGKQIAYLEDVETGELEAITLYLTEGEQRIDVFATNAAGDFTTVRARIIVDTMPPALQIGQPEITGTVVSISGKVESAAILFVNEMLLTPDSEGSFVYSENLQGRMKASFLFEARDAAGNVTTGRQEVILPVALSRVELQPVATEGMHHLQVGEIQDLQLVGYDANGVSYSIPAELTEFEVLAGEELLISQRLGEWQAIESGRAIISAGIRVSEDYAFYDAVILDILNIGEQPNNNRPPLVRNLVTDHFVQPGQRLALDFREIFSDPEGLPLSISVDSQVGTLSGTTWTFDATHEDLGEHLIVVIARDPEGAHVSCSFIVTVRLNQAPVVTQLLSDLQATVGQHLNVDLISIFADADGDELTLSANGIGVITNNKWVYTALNEHLGNNVVTITAADPFGATAACSFRVTVNSVPSTPIYPEAPEEHSPQTPQSNTTSLTIDGIPGDWELPIIIKDGELRLVFDGPQMQSLLAQLAAAKDTSRLVITLPELDSVDSYTVYVGSMLLEAAAKNLVLVISTPSGELSMPLAAFEGLSQPSSNEWICLTLREVEGEELDSIIEALTGEVVLRGATLDLSAAVVTLISGEQVNNTNVTEFARLVAVTIDVSHLGELSEDDIASLSGVRFVFDAEGVLSAVSLGGMYDPFTGTFTFYTERFSLYTVAQIPKATLNITLTLGSRYAMVNGKEIRLDVEPYAVSGRSMVPLRFIAEAMQAEVDWIEETKTVVIVLEGREIRLVLGHIDPAVGLDVPAQLAQGRTLVPLRYVSEALGAKVEWLEESSAVIITK